MELEYEKSRQQGRLSDTLDKFRFSALVRCGIIFKWFQENFPGKFCLLYIDRKEYSKAAKKNCLRNH